MFFLLAAEVLPLPDLLHLRALCEYGNYLYLAGRGGVGIADALSGELLYACATSQPVDAAAPDPAGSDVYFLSGGWIWRWSPGFGQPVRLGPARGSSIGVGFRCVFVDGRAFNRAGGETSGCQDNLVVWAGPKANLNLNSAEARFLAPFYIWSQTAGRVPIRFAYKSGRRLWVGTDGLGVYLYSVNFPQDSLRPTPGLSEVKALALLGDSLWAGGPEGLFLRQGRFWTPYTKEGALFWCQGIRGIFVDKDKVILAADCGILVLRGERAQLVRTRRAPEKVALVGGKLYYSASDGVYSQRGRVLGSAWVRDISPYRGKLAAATRDGLYLVDSAGATLLKTGSAYRLAAWKDTLWVLTSELLGWDGKKLFKLLELPVDPASVNALAVSEKWVALGCEDGLRLFYRKEGRWEHLTAFNGLPSDKVLAVIIKGDTLFAGTERGLAAVF